MGAKDNLLLRWLVYQVAWRIVKREARRRRRKIVAAGVVGMVVGVGAAIALRSRPS